jgi:hypothetical protein
MAHLIVVTAAGKSLLISGDDNRSRQIVGCKKITTRTGVHLPAQQKRQQLFLTLASPLEK